MVSPTYSCINFIVTLQIRPCHHVWQHCQDCGGKARRFLAQPNNQCHHLFVWKLTEVFTWEVIFSMARCGNVRLWVLKLKHMGHNLMFCFFDNIMMMIINYFGRAMKNRLQLGSIISWWIVFLVLSFQRKCFIFSMRAMTETVFHAWFCWSTWIDCITLIY